MTNGTSIQFWQGIELLPDLISDRYLKRMERAMGVETESRMMISSWYRHLEDVRQNQYKQTIKAGKDTIFDYYLN